MTNAGVSRDVVTLSWAEVQVAAVCGVMRQILNLKQGNRDTYGFQGDPWGTHIDGCLAELAVAKYTGRYWEPVASDFRSLDGDVGERLQVRSTSHESGSLILHPSDPDDHLFVLVVSRLHQTGRPEFTVCGGIRATLGKQQEFWRKDVRHPAFFVPQHHLHPIMA